MRTEEDFKELEIQIKRLTRENERLKLTLLDQFAIASLSSGRCSPMECYTWAEMALDERKKHVGP